MDFPYDRTLASAIRPRDNSSYRAVNPRRANVQGGKAKYMVSTRTRPWRHAAKACGRPPCASRS
ncbi:hypothetical protein HMPREF3196_00873 [Bifidobacterium bifidum]|uniref:Uncharacterized protein n=1 Tax=Bifidobacterium bifidum TaxID=1681 RepID=A0A133KQA2_BIFBI|nr:hypothetical protein HMPREF3196_00873 [Bifidobacterium bifidum]